VKQGYSSLKDDDVFLVTDFKCTPAQAILDESGLFKIIWSREMQVHLTVDGYQLSLKKDEVVFCTPLNILTIPADNEGIVTFVFNKEFFCIQTHDDQVSCQGFLFFGSAQPQVIGLPDDVVSEFDLMYRLFLKDLAIKDHLQGEMLRSLLKRLLIISTRLLKEDLHDPAMDTTKLDLVRSYHLLVEQHFKVYHQVQDYAKLLYKSPKTLSNLFAKHIGKSPLQIINERIILEAKRLLTYSTKSADEIAHELGYSDAAHFSRFFKKQTESSPSAFRKNKQAASIYSH
jgi:AraC-like DNA-binding protein